MKAIERVTPISGFHTPDLGGQRRGPADVTAGVVEADYWRQTTRTFLFEHDGVLSSWSSAAFI